MGFFDFREPVNTWTHGAWLLLSLPASLLLWRESRGDRPKQLSLAIYGVTLAACFAGSALYHGLPHSETHDRLLLTLDYIGIFLLIAGTYTPAAFTLLRGRRKWSILVG